MRVCRFESRGALIVIAASLALAGCGDEPPAESERPARIPAGAAERLASLSDETAAALEAGDPCGAELAAQELARTAEEVEPRIPVQLRPEVRAGVEQLASLIECVPPAVGEEQPPEPEDGCPPGTVRKDEGEGKDGKGKKEDRDEDDSSGPGNGGDDEGGKGNERDRKDEEKRIEEECEEVGED
jgi:hypothetical protein